LALVVAARTGEPSHEDAVTVDDAAADSSDVGVVAAGGEAGSASLPGVAGDLPVLAGDDAVRLLDFREIDQPGDACDQGLEGDTPGVIPVEEGQSDLLDPDRFARLNVDGVVGYTDLDSDGSDEAVVHAVCAFGANGAQDTVQVWDLGSGRPEATASLAEAPASIVAPFPPTVKDVAVEDGAVVVTWLYHGEGEPHCCPTLEAPVSYQLVGDALTVTGGS
jgi:hypothetical protein